MSNSLFLTAMSLIKDLPYSFRKRCEAIASEQRSAIRIRAFDACPARLLAEALQVTIMLPNEIPNSDPQQLALLTNSDSWSAGIVRKNPTWIVYNPRHSSTRWEASIMHEIAHILLQHQPVGFDRTTGLPLRHYRNEQEANFLGGCLQIPRRGLLWAAQNKMNRCEVAQHFLASKAMVNCRCNITGVKLE